MSFNFRNFLNGFELNAYEFFGARPMLRNGVSGFLFRTYAPLAKRVRLFGDFNAWDSQGIELAKTDPYGIFEVFVPGVQTNQKYKYLITTRLGVELEKMDAYEFAHELRPGSASLTYDPRDFCWSDTEFLENRSDNYDRPVSIFELHLGSFKKPDDKDYYTYRELSTILIAYVKKYGFTHVEFMPITQHPFDGSWGYQSLGFFAPDSRYGNPDDFKYLVNELHRHNIGVIFDYVPLHFASDDYGLVEYDGSRLFEYNDDRRLSPWGSIQFDLGKDPVRSFLMSSINYFFQEYHLDGVRIDAVANIIFYNGDKERGLNTGGVDFIKRANELLKKENPEVMLIAEDSTDFLGVTRSIVEDGLGFDYKWDLGWMNDTLKYYEAPDSVKKEKHHSLTFSMAYFYNERFLLPLSHDEVVHGKKSVMNKMHGEYEERFALVRNLYLYQFSHPGKKLNFMGNELGVYDEWNEARQFPSVFEELPLHLGVRVLFTDLNTLYQAEECLFQKDYDYRNFAWLMLYNDQQSVYVFERFVGASHLIFVFNMSRVDYPVYDIKTRNNGEITEKINTCDPKYQGIETMESPSKTYHTRKNKDEQLPFAFTIHLKPYMAAIYKLVKGE